MCSVKRATVGTVYCLHLDQPFGHMTHYRGFARDLEARLAEHATGRGANVLRHVRAAGIGWTLARTWEHATRRRERQLKRQGGAARQCPICREERRARRRQQPRLFTLRAGAMRPARATA